MSEQDRIPVTFPVSVVEVSPAVRVSVESGGRKMVFSLGGAPFEDAEIEQIASDISFVVSGVVERGLKEARNG